MFKGFTYFMQLLAYISNQFEAYDMIFSLRKQLLDVYIFTYALV